MIAAALGVLTASLLGSLHCAGMCGGLVALYAGSERAGRRRAWAAHAAYSAGRLGAYATLGALGGLAGAVLDLGGRMAGVQGVAALAAGLLIAAWGLTNLVGARGIRGSSLPRPVTSHLLDPGSPRRPRPGTPHPPGPGTPQVGPGMPRLPGPGEAEPAPRRMPKRPSWRAGVSGLPARALAAVAGMSPPTRGLVVGLVTGLLPCGWLWAFVVVAAGTGQPLAGALLMTAFWAGTLPVMLTVGVGLQALAAPFRRYLPTASGLVMVSLGLLAVLGRLLGHHHGP